MSHTFFRFKKFAVAQSRSAMKVGTDSVILGAWTSIKHNPSSILDIGAGTGILSLMLAQRSHATIIDALEIDESAYEECVENFENSSWNDRLFCYHASLKDFVLEMDETYDLIVCNPPFFSENYKSKSPTRDQARFNDALPFDFLLKSVSKLLSESGIFSVIIPFKEEKSFMALASKLKLHPNDILHVQGNPESQIKRSLITFSFNKTKTKTEKLVIETTRHHYTEKYIDLTKDFYLKM